MNEILSEIVELDLNCTSEETSRRNKICCKCDSNVPTSEESPIPFCNECECPIAMLITLNVKSCPIGKW